MNTTAISTDTGRLPGAAPTDKDVASAILGSAIEQFRLYGFHGASMRRLAERAGVNVSNVYNYFPAKSDILLGILRRAVTEQIIATETAIAGAGKAVVDRYVAAVEAFVLFDIEYLDVSFIANSELRYLDASQREEIVAVRDRLQDIFVNLLREGVEEGVFRTPYPNEATTAMLTMCGGVTVWYRPNGRLSPTEVAKRYARYALAMVEGI